MQTGFIAAIDLGTSKIKGIVGRMNENNIFSVLASGEISSDGCIRRGIVYNMKETGAKINGLVSFLQNTINRKIAKVYVSLNGQSLHSEEFRQMKQLASSGIVTESVIEQLRQSAEKYRPELNKKYAIADVEYFVDDRSENNPVGVSCAQIEAEFEIIIGRASLLPNIEKSIKDKTSLDIADYVVGPLASAAIALTKEDKELGCAFIDFGAGTTTLSVYKSGILRQLVVIPFGGRNITKDICELNFTEKDAEEYKCKFGKATDTKENTKSISPFSSPFSLSSSQKTDIDLVELNKVIRMRLNEITANIKEQIRLSGYEGQLGAGLIITGGASQLKNLDLYLTEKLNMAVRKVSARKSFINNSPDLVNNPSYTQLLGMLLFGKENCEEIIVENIDEQEDSDEDSTVSSNRFQYMRDKLKKQQLQKEREREKEIEKERKRKEKEEREKARASSDGGIFKTLRNTFGGLFDEEKDEDDDN